ncbi:MAG: Aerobic-type carbon monoxide dehydrogenase middle subunit CoxM/CutM [Fusobacteria bacterium]|nr:MAG: Aerobic-type carbon monoxide dehydrogenase middle subunit CoxM/CutM [Fusobacteriota bacterium]KAF0229056.1 MAG: Aerobic-type carbon monoxide dehydrogenase middle subunit [Fusobacteriota bacterium]
MYDIKKIHQANSVQDVLRIIEENPNTKIISGGTDVLIKMKERKLKDVEIVSIGDISELKGISIDGNGTIIIKAATCFIDIITNADILRHIPTLAKACNQIGSPQIRNIATIGGNLCNGAVSADVVPILLVLDAELHINNVNGEVRIIDVNDLHTGPGQTSLDDGKEILTEIHIKKVNYQGYGFDYFKYGKRNAMEIATLGCATGVKLNEEKNKIADFKISYSVAAPTPRRCRSLERLIIGEDVSQDTINLIKPENIEELKPRDSWRASKDFRLQLIKEIGRRTAIEAIRSQGGM